MVAEATPVLAAAGLARLGSMPDAAAAVDSDACDRLMRTAADPSKPMTLRRDIVALAGRRRLAAAAPRLDAAGYHNSGIVDRHYFTSAYVREPNSFTLDFYATRGGGYGALKKALEMTGRLARIPMRGTSAFR